MAPPGTLVAVHIKPNMHKYCESHSKKGWFVGPALSHHRNVQCCFPHAKSEIMSDTMDLFANAEVIPTISNEEYIQQVLMDILTVLQTKQKAISHLYNMVKKIMMQSMNRLNHLLIYK